METVSSMHHHPGKYDTANYNGQINDFGYTPHILRNNEHGNGYKAGERRQYHNKININPAAIIWLCTSGNVVYWTGKKDKPGNDAVRQCKYIPQNHPHNLPVKITFSYQQENKDGKK